jgi:hypothetical protein
LRPTCGLLDVTDLRYSRGGDPYARARNDVPEVRDRRSEQASLGRLDPPGEPLEASQHLGKVDRVLGHLNERYSRCEGNISIWWRDLEVPARKTQRPRTHHPDEDVQQRMAVARETLLVGRGLTHTLNLDGEPRSEAFWAQTRFVLQAELRGHRSITPSRNYYATCVSTAACFFFHA